MTFRILTAFLVALPLAASAQQEIGLHFNRELWQSHKTNPAFLPAEGLTIGLPGLHNTLFFTGPTYGDALRQENGGTVLDVDNLIAQLEDRNLVRENLDIETIGIAFSTGKWRFGFQHTARFSGFLDYPKELPQLVWKGNAQFVGQTIELGNDLQIFSYNEFGLAAAVELAPVTLGARVKFLTGIGDVSTAERQSIALTTDEEFYQLTLVSDYQLNTSASFDYESFNDFQLNYDFGRIDPAELFNNNTGWSVDLGVDVDLGKLSLAASVVDLGQITWNKEVRNYLSDGTFVYDGLDISQALTGDSVNFSQALDTLEQIFHFDSTSVSYQTDLPAKVYLSGTFELTDSWRIGGLLFNEWYRGKRFPAAAVNVQTDLGSWLTVGANYAVYRNTYSNLGLTAILHLGPVQLYALTDNIVAAFHPNESRYFTFRTGLNLRFQ